MTSWLWVLILRLQHLRCRRPTALQLSPDFRSLAILLQPGQFQTCGFRGWIIFEWSKNHCRWSLLTVIYRIYEKSMTLIVLVQSSDSFHSKLTYWERLQSLTSKQKRMQPSLHDQDRFPQIPGLKIHCFLESIQCFDDFRCCSHDLTGHLHPKHHMSLWTLLKVGYFL